MWASSSPSSATLPAAMPALLLLLFWALLLAGAAEGRAATVAALFAFGDSLLDPGNNDQLPTIAKSDFPPYGRDFEGHLPTGRFSNGKIATDIMASSLGLKDLLPAYLDPKLKPEDLLTGVSFASAGSGYDDLTATVASVLSIWEQLDMFQECIEKLKAQAGEERAGMIISNSLYVVSGGSNDLLITYFDTTLRQWHFDAPTYVNLLIHSASTFVKELYHLGARRIALVGLTPLGCLPLQRSFKGGVHRNCEASANQAAIIFNSMLKKEAENLSSQLKGSSIVYLNLYDPVKAVIRHPSRYGFTESSRGCCGTGKLEIAALCNDANPYTCPNASQYAFWDSIHPSERHIEIVVAQLLKKDLSRIL